MSKIRLKVTAVAYIDTDTQDFEESSDYTGVTKEQFEEGEVYIDDYAPTFTVELVDND